MVASEAQRPGRASTAPIKNVGKYRIDELLGRGAFGLVYKGHDLQIDRVVAIKTLRPEVLADLNENAEQLKRFGAEVRSAGRCMHQNIVTIFDYVEDAGAPYIIMEYVPAGTLDEVVKSGARLSIHQVGAIMEQLLLALDHAHAKGIIHRDIKPSNILCYAAMSIKVADFGTAYVESLELTRPGQFSPIGTPYYSAPERFLGRAADARGDVYSAGVVLYQLLTGQRPFIATDINDLMNQVLNRAPQSVKALRPDLSDPIDEVVRRSLARNPDDRFSSARNFLEALAGAVDRGAVDPSPPLDLTTYSSSPKNKEKGGSASPPLNLSMVERLKPETLVALERTISPWLGPMSKLLVKRAAAESMDAEHLLVALLDPLRSSADAANVRKQVESVLMADHGLMAGQLVGAIKPAEIEAIAIALMPSIGPVIRPLVARLAKTAVGSDDFYSRLTKELSRPQDRETLSRLYAKLRPDKAT